MADQSLHRCDYQRYGGGWRPVTAITLSANVCQITWTGTLAENKTLIINCGAKAYSTTTTQPTVDCHSVLSIILTNGSSWNRRQYHHSYGHDGGTNPDIRFSFRSRGNEQHSLGQCRNGEWRCPGIGPLELLSFSHTKRLDRAGSVSFSISGVTGRTYLVKPRRYIRAFGMIGDGATPDIYRAWRRDCGQHHAQQRLLPVG